jgi:hypothetical protein
MRNRSDRRRLALAWQRRHKQHVATDTSACLEQGSNYSGTIPSEFLAGGSPQYHPNDDHQNSQETASERSIAKSTRNITRLTGVLAVIAFVSAIVSGFQWWEIHSGSADTKALADAAKAQAAATVGQLGVMQSQLGEMKSSGEQTNKIIENYKRLADTAEAAQRAWVGPLTAIITAPVINEGAKVTISYTNSGKETAAINAGADFAIFSKEEWVNGSASKSI